MEILKESIKNISPITGEFKNLALERDFQKYMLQDTIASSRKFILGIALLFQLYIIPDYFYFKSQDILLILALIRLLYLFASLYYYTRIPHTKYSLYQSTNVYELNGILLLWALLFVYPEAEIMSHQQTHTIFMLAILLIIPNRFWYKICLSLLLMTGIFFISEYKGAHCLTDFSGAMLIFTMLVLLFSAFTARRINKLQRIQFEDSLALERLSTTDMLTKTFNRRKYQQDLEKEIARTQRYRHSFSGIMFDLDDFKEVNDSYGHLAGDEVLRKLSFHVKSLIRENDQLFRWGGEEFIILLPDTDLEAALKLSNRIKAELKNVDFSSLPKPTCSFGVAAWQENDTAESFTTRMDRLLYQAKANGKDCIVSDSFSVKII